MEMTVDLAKKIGDKLKVNWNAITPDSLAKGAKVEMEHEDLFPEAGDTLWNWVIACKIAHTHLKERPDYYIKLADMEHSPVMQRKPEEPLVKQEYKKVIEQMVEEVLKEMHYPPKAFDYNKLRDTDGFWSWSVRDAAERAGLVPLPPPFKNVGTVILWLNTAAGAWEEYAKSMGKK
jgi:hypothetical protein